VSLLRIGAFARRASVSVKTLRFYDAAGVFRPVRIDAHSGYRYYASTQLAELAELRELRSLGCSVAELRTWVGLSRDAPERVQLLLYTRERLRAQLAVALVRERRVQAWARRLALQGAVVPRERTIPAIAALTTRERVRSIAPAVYQMFEATERLVAREEARGLKSPFLLLHDGDFRDKHADVEVCVPVDPAAMSALGARWVAGAPRAASVSFSGSYSRAPNVYAAIKGWLSLEGVHATGPLRETYLRFGADQVGYSLPGRMTTKNVADYRTVLQVPIERRAGPLSGS
jgi:DNA-binding transcriptional MerR regulator